MARYELKSAIHALRDQPQNFALFRGEDADQVLITPNPATTKQIAELEAECGKFRRILGGLCFRDGDRLVFSTKFRPAPAWEMMITGVLRDRKCPPTVPIDLRQLAPNEPEEVISQPELYNPASPREDQPPDIKDKWEHLKTSMLPDLKKALAESESKDAVAKTVAAASAAEKAGDYAAAIALLEPLASSLFLDALSAENLEIPSETPPE